MNFIAMDYETASGKRASACSVAIVVVRNDKVVDSFYNLINPETPFSPFNIRIHHITPDMVANAPTFPELWPHIAPLFTRTQLVAAHNAQFDVSVLRKSLERYGLPTPQYQYIDTVATSRSFLPSLANHKLDTVSDALGITLNNHHNALADSYACARILMSEKAQFGSQALNNFIKLA
ncbi:3'-5' exonuclease [Lacticaseibacillus thailandensis]|uniref:DNA polymerase III polC-type n=1 Tax=Lacticaseibacillus thailandensis DSM 22698 = JCM 13996 TaxID=1423810 RepID=A0A0R2CIX3_9LACO|nr:3'-5' exonuclease [Lacticaseibacillus thailandensis]KRM88379.1 DNA polymerase III epsilon subunit [Lacticaseibacillus thailandensis DSM 22698 = JCM 13996]